MAWAQKLPRCRQICLNSSILLHREIHHHTQQVLAARGTTVVLLVRNLALMDKVIAEIKAEVKTPVDFRVRLQCSLLAAQLCNGHALHACRSSCAI